MASSLSSRALLAGAVLVAAALLLPARHAVATADDKARAPASANDKATPPSASGYDSAKPPTPTPADKGAPSPAAYDAKPPSSSPGDMAVPPSPYDSSAPAPLLPLVSPPPPPPLPFVIVEGVIYCKSCRGKGYNTGIDAESRTIPPAGLQGIYTPTSVLFFAPAAKGQCPY
nr:unnamed protein product [Digitaria exilis]